MKRSLIPLLLGLLLLSGCAAQNPNTESTLPSFAATQPTAPPAPASMILKSQGDGTLHTYDLAFPLNGLLPLGDGLLAFSGSETATVSLLDTNAMTISASWEPGFLLMPENATLQKLDSGISCFDSSRMETVVLDNALRVIRRIAAPDDLSGFPLLSADGQTLFYCTAHAVRAMDLNNGISRILKEAAYPVQGLSGLLLDGDVLQISITDTDGQWRTLFLSSQTGQLLKECSGNVLPETNGNDYFLQGQAGSRITFFGKADGAVKTFQPLGSGQDLFFLPEYNQVISFRLADSQTSLDLYDLETGRRIAEGTLSGQHFPKTARLASDGRIWFLCYEESALHCWNPAGSPVTDKNRYTGAHYTRQEPDYDGLAACTLYAGNLSEKYGMDILVYKDAVATEPWDYHLDYEYQADLLLRELEALDNRLGAFPEGFLQTLTGKFTNLTISLVRSVTGSPESGSRDAVNGIQFMVDFDAYLVLATDRDPEYALYHELSHLMETVVLTESTAYDRWDNLNPEGFQYEEAYLDRDCSSWMKPGTEYFIDSYSTSHPREDRARLFEYAMTSGHAALFSSPNLQHKLRQMCTGIREAFDLEACSAPLLWEQYLQEPLA